ncbi:hypothetical protein [Paraferrimonas sp. SM1919]|uniref:hypothetical protein n=1 Tax=Paraferrimonas sp. SM1919 TaxID=2662263 RepID=UPI0013D33D19|nr:hypothetical protein [Paraferrimonas sp. SM1919]
MSTHIQFYKKYTRQSRSPWDDSARVVMMFDPETKAGIYLHIGDSGFNGFAISEKLQQQLPENFQKQYLEAKYAHIVLASFCEEIEAYCRNHVVITEFQSIFLSNQNTFFSDYAKAAWQQSLNLL